MSARAEAQEIFVIKDYDNDVGDMMMNGNMASVLDNIDVIWSYAMEEVVAIVCLPSGK